MAKRKEGGRRANLIRCYLTDGEYSKLLSYSTSMNISVSDLIRAKLLYSGMLDVDPAKLLEVFIQIAKDIARIRSDVSGIYEILGQEKGAVSVEHLLMELRGALMECQADTACLEKAIRMMLIRMDRKEKML